ncbi:hypothetical protein [Vulcanisaeta distributa]|uniref:Uncharacterized protein n=1 Tax=Vulcanisaeta distributa (strain DSM 14429 / JCM 11212 / NBRC 100878 / IC-017) TaxID=572478 RepID=E1QUL1_VULDI|nr:hypothetical protein [Vulcanisaeta distributa]ADN51130.1 hypothetical protein Vdis_1756 [Vulcanisaeta distributa DSM 14429]
MSNVECIDDLLNALMTFYSVAVIEHYMIFLLLIKSRNNEAIHDQLLNTVRDHLDKENRMLNNMLRLLMECFNENTTSLVNEFVRNVQDGITLINDPEFISNYINDFATAVKTLVKYVLNHEELLSRVVNLLRENVRKYISSFT